MPIEDRSLDFPEDDGDTARVFDASDRQWVTRKGRFESLNDTGTNVSGHYMMIKKNAVFANAVERDTETIFEIHSHSEMKDGNVYTFVILESNSDPGDTPRVVAINETDDTVIVKNDLDPSLFDTLKKVQDDHPEVLFYKEPKERGSEHFCLKSFLSGKQRILGFDENGHAMNTAQVQQGDKASLFRMMPFKD